MAGTVEDIERDDEWYFPALEVVDRGEAIGQPARVGEHHRAERAKRELVPHEPEPLLPGRAEQVEHQVLAERDAAKVHRHRRGGLALHARRVVDVLADLRQRFLGPQWPDLAHRTDQRGLAYAEPAGEQDLDRAVPAGCRPAVSLIAPVGHGGPPSAFLCQSDAPSSGPVPES